MRNRKRRLKYDWSGDFPTATGQSQSQMCACVECKEVRPRYYITSAGLCADCHADHFLIEHGWMLWITPSFLERHCMIIETSGDGLRESIKAALPAKKMGAMLVSLLGMHSSESRESAEFRLVARGKTGMPMLSERMERLEEEIAFHESHTNESGDNRIHPRAREPKRNRRLSKPIGRYRFYHSAYGASMKITGPMRLDSGTSSAVWAGEWLPIRDGDVPDICADERRRREKIWRGRRLRDTPIRSCSQVWPLIPVT